MAFLSNNDLVTACSDYKARIWSIDASRKASADIQEAYQAALAPKQSGARRSCNDKGVCTVQSPGEAARKQAACMRIICCSRESTRIGNR